MLRYHNVVSYKHSSTPLPVSAPDVDPALAEVLAAFGEFLVAQRRLRGRDARHPGDLSFAQLRLLAALEEGESCPAGQLAQQAGVSPATVTGMLDNLEQMGMVTRVRSTEDRRVVLTRLSDEGRRARDEKRSEARAAFGRALSSLAPDELAAAPRVLRLLATAMEDM
jgi:DNA-binding MarR family transcriptional regulator